MKKLVCRFLCLGIVLAVSMNLVGCSDDDGPVGTLYFPRDVCMVDKPGGTASVEFTAVNIVKLNITDTPEGWTVTADLQTSRMTVTAPASDDSDAETGGVLTLVGYDTDGKTVSADLRVGIGRTVDLTGRTANCYIANYANAYYTFDGTVKGNGEKIPTARVELMWGSTSHMIENLTLDDGRVSFFVAADKKGEFIEGNALIAAFDAQDKVVWSWHVWVTQYDPSAESVTSAAGDVFMTRNLGAGAGGNATEDDIYLSYGLYYQWGRPTPMIGPAYYNCAFAEDHKMYNINGRLTYLDYVESTPETGTMEYAIAYPMSFILGVEESGYDWLYSDHDNELWGAVKTVYDPCPKGWKVPDKDVYADFMIGDDHDQEQTEALREAYGWNLTDGTMTSFFLGGGRRPYLTGLIQNVNSNADAQPWIGCYWTSGLGTDELSASGLYFSLDTDDAASSEFVPARNYQRANGLQLYSDHDNELWGAVKTVYDPCPKGWKVPDKDVYADFMIGDDHDQEQTEALREAYGWNLTDGTMTSFFLGGGRRPYLTGLIQNVNSNADAQPWIGCYWTSGLGTDELSASGLYFSLDTDDAASSEFVPARNYQRANGLQVRCVRE